MVNTKFFGMTEAHAAKGVGVAHKLRRSLTACRTAAFTVAVAISAARCTGFALPVTPLPVSSINVMFLALIRICKCRKISF